ERPVRMESANGPLSLQQSRDILERLKQKSGASDILERHLALEEAIAGSPLVVGNKVILLEDGTATYKAMFAAIHGARHHINLESFIFEDDEIGRLFSDQLVGKQKQGVQVNLIYDSIGSLRTKR